MDAKEQVMAAEDYFDTDEAKGAIQRAVSKGKDHVIIDFNDLIANNIDLANDLLDDPERTLQAMNHALQQGPRNLPPYSVVRIKNISKTTIIPINKVRKEHEGLLVTVEGVIKQKSSVKGQIIVTKYECGSCGNIIPIAQIDDRKVSKPRICNKCAARTTFRVLSDDKIDIFSMMLEELPSDDVTTNKLETIKILARAGLANSSVERKMYQGVKVRVMGVLKSRKVLINGQETNMLDWYVDANYVELLDDSFTDIKWDEKIDVPLFKKLSKREDLMKVFQEHIFPDIYGYYEEKEGVILQLFNGDNEYIERSFVRNISHVLLVGDAGCAKSSMLKSINLFSPKSRYVAGVGVSAVGLTGAAVKDELLGGWTFEAGAIPMTNNGTLCLDELDKVSDDNKKALHEPLEDMQVSIDKGAVHVTLPANTAVLAAANPKYGKYSVYDSFYSQIDLPQPIFSRFDLIYVIRSDGLSREQHSKILQKIMFRGSKKHRESLKNLEFSREFLLKYIAYSKIIKPEMSEEAAEYINEQWLKLVDFQEKNKDRKDILSLNNRYCDAMRRLSMNIARMHLKDTVTKEYIEKSYNMLMYSIRMLGVEPGSGDEIVEFTTISGGKLVVQQKDIYSRIKKIFREYYNQNKKPMSLQELKAIMSNEGFTDVEKIEDVVNKMNFNGEIINVKGNSYKLTG